MNKFLKLFYALLIGVLSVGFVSCGDDDDEPENPSGNNLAEKLQGTWTFDLMKIQVMGQTIEMDRDQLVDNSGYENFYDDVLTFNGSKVNGLDYQIDGNKILLPWYSDLDWWQSVSFSGNEMTFFLDIVYEGIPMKMWITYTKNGSRAVSAPNINASTSIVEAYLRKM